MNSPTSDNTPAAPGVPVDRLQRWRLVLGGEADASCGAALGSVREMDEALAALYEPNGANGLGRRRGGRGNS